MKKVFDRCPLVLLCAGESRRAGIPKGLYAHQGRPWLLTQLDSFARAGGRRLIVVLGYHTESYLTAFPWLRAESSKTTPPFGLELLCTINPHPECGQFSSVQQGLRELQNLPCDAAFVLPVDVPIAEKYVWLSLSKCLDKNIKAVIPVYEGKGGHPVLLSYNFAQELCRATEARLDHQLQALPAENVRRLSVDDRKVVLNLNRSEDFERFA